MRLDWADVTAVIALLRQVAAAEVMPRWRHLAAGDIRAKSGPHDPVTVADEAAERALAAGLQALFPGTDVIGEEAVAAAPALLGRLHAPGAVWVVDPIDGTSNFAADLPLFGMMLALVEGDEVLAGFIHDPLGDDTAVALVGGGAWMVAPDGARRRLRVAAACAVEDMAGAIHWRYLPAALRGRVMRRLDRLAAVLDYRCAAHEHRWLAGGHGHVLLVGRVLPWDHAAGFLLHQEAGGFARRFDGSEYMPSETGGGLLLAPDAAAWARVREILLDE